MLIIEVSLILCDLATSAQAKSMRTTKGDGRLLIAPQQSSSFSRTKDARRDRQLIVIDDIFN